MKFTSLKTKLATTISVAVGIIFSLIILYSVITNRKTAIESSEREITLLAQEYALKIEVEIEQAIDASNTMASIFSSFKNNGDFKPSRIMMNNLLKQVLNDNPNFLATYTLWEINAFDNNDSEYIDKAGHDGTGRFIPYFTRNSKGGFTLEPIVDYTESGAGDYYLIPKETKKEAVIEPYLYPVQGKNVLITSLVAPVLVNNEFVAIAGVDIAVDFIQHLALEAKEEIYNGNAEISIIANNGTYAANTKNVENVGENISELKDSAQLIISKIKKGEIFQTQNSEILEINVPINIGATTTAWSINISIQKNIIFAETNKQILILIIFGIISIVLIVFVSRYIAETFTTPIKEVVKALEKMAQKQINFQMDTKRQDEIGTLYNSINQMNNVFTKMITGIDETASSVLTASKQLSTISQEISQRANEQAATTEEVATSMEQMLATINSNTQNAEITEKTSTKSANRLKQSELVFKQTINSVSEISKKISIITEIANKTDMLSINAAIEAARAGESGKGFSIVANEIRKLADKTKKASDEITELSGKGTSVSKITGKTLEKLIPEIIISAKLVSNIVSSGKEQQTSAKNINISVVQLADITNENSASAEEMSASAEELSAQATLLKSLIASSVMDITGIKQDDQHKNEDIRKEQTLEPKKAGVNIILSDNDKANDEFESF